MNSSDRPCVTDNDSTANFTLDAGEGSIVSRYEVQLRSRIIALCHIVCLVVKRVSTKQFLLL
jgi:hypothetical protein